MPTKKLTDLFVERVKPPPRGRAEYFDAAFPGLAFRVTENGGKSWSVFYRMTGRLRRFTIGSYPAIKPAQARREASAALERVRQGFDPSDEKRARRYLPSPETETFGAVAQDYLDRHLKKNNAPSTYQEAKRDLETNALTKWRHRPLASITRRDVLDLIDGIIAREAEIQANRTLARLRALFNWAIEKDRLAVSPVHRMKAPTKERARDRVLTDDELRWFLASCDEIGWPFGPLFKLLLFTAQRRDEVAGMSWAEFDVDGKRTWTIPRQRVKNDRGHEVQLSDAAIAVLHLLPEIAIQEAQDDDAGGRCTERKPPNPNGKSQTPDEFPHNGLVFTVTGETAVSGFSRAKERLDAAMVRARRRSLGLPEADKEYRKEIGIAAGKPLPVEIPDWRLHDLRRTAATGMARLKFPPHVVDKILNHTSGTIRGVAAVYNQFAYLDERRDALEAWGRYVGSLMAPERSANVIALR
jgi:integrase